MEQVAMDESFISKRLEADVSRFENTYSSLIDEAAETFNTAYKGNREWSIHDTVGLGQYLESWEKYAQMFEEDLTTRDTLGDYLKVGLGLAAVQQWTL